LSLQHDLAADLVIEVEAKVALKITEKNIELMPRHGRERRVLSK
jgi:hypothetical protein